MVPIDPEEALPEPARWRSCWATINLAVLGSGAALCSAAPSRTCATLATARTRFRAARSDACNDPRAFKACEYRPGHRRLNGSPSRKRSRPSCPPAGHANGLQRLAPLRRSRRNPSHASQQASARRRPLTHT